MAVSARSRMSGAAQECSRVELFQLCSCCGHVARAEVAQKTGAVPLRICSRPAPLAAGGRERDALAVPCRPPRCHFRRRPRLPSSLPPPPQVTHNVRRCRRRCCVDALLTSALHPLPLPNVLVVRSCCCCCSAALAATFAAAAAAPAAALRRAACFCHVGRRAPTRTASCADTSPAVTAALVSSVQGCRRLEGASLAGAGAGACGRVRRAGLDET